MGEVLCRDSASWWINKWKGRMSEQSQKSPAPLPRNHKVVNWRFGAVPVAVLPWDRFQVLALDVGRQHLDDIQKKNRWVGCFSLQGRLGYLCTLCHNVSETVVRIITCICNTVIATAQMSAMCGWGCVAPQCSQVPSPAQQTYFTFHQAVLCLPSLLPLSTVF